jgi:hypothetical protein
MHALDYVQAEPESEVQEKQIPEVFKGPQTPSFMDTNIFPKQDKSWYIPPISFDFWFSINIYITT